MKSDKKLTEIIFEIYREMYKQATPSADFDKLHEEGETAKENWFMKYWLPYEEQDKIMEDIMKKHKLSKYDKRKISINIHLGASPRGYKENYDERD